MKYFEALDEYVFFSSLESKVLQVSPDGKNGAWLYQREKEEYIWNGDVSFPLDVLADYNCIREQMGTKALFIFWGKNKFRVKLVYKERVGGYKEPFHEACFASSSGHSVKEALDILNEKLRDFKPTDCLVEMAEYPILQFPISRLELVKNK